MRSPEVQVDFAEFLASLNAARVRFLVVGAYAVAAHGVPRRLHTPLANKRTAGRAKDLGDIEALARPREPRRARRS